MWFYVKEKSLSLLWLSSPCSTQYCKLSGVNQKLSFPSEWGPLFPGPESDSSPVSFFRLNAYFESSPRINTEVISDFFRNDNSTVIVDLYFHGDELLGLSYMNCYF